MNTITLPDISDPIAQVNALDKVMSEVIAEEGPDYVYQTPGDGTLCRYVYDGQPSCLVGRILHRFGVSLEALSEAEKCGPHQTRQAFEGLSYEARLFLGYAQQQQDTGVTWGAAQDYARRGVKIIFADERNYSGAVAQLTF